MLPMAAAAAGVSLEAAFDKPAHRVRLRIDDNRVIVNALEPRGCFAEWDGKRLHLSLNGQGVWNQKNRLVDMLGLTPEQVRVTNPDVGGGFGMKAMMLVKATPGETATARMAGMTRRRNSKVHAKKPSYRPRRLAMARNLSR